MLKGLDYSFGNGVTAAQVKDAGFAFVCRYISGGNSKDISKAELDNYIAAGVRVVFVWETWGQMTSEAEGVSDAKAAHAQLTGLGASDAVVFFAQDIPWQTTTADQVAYMRGAASVIGLGRCGGYGDYATIQALFGAGVIRYGWQTYGGSNGQWDDRALLRQYLNGQKFGPAQVDFDEAAFWSSTKVLGVDDDFGQYPRPSAPPPPQSGPYPHTFSGHESIGEAAKSRGMTMAAWVAEQSRLGADVADWIWNAKPPAGTGWKSLSP